MTLVGLVAKALGRKLTYRLGRALYMHSRGDIANDMATNGELMVQESVISAVEQSTREKLVCFDVGANVGVWSSAFVAECDRRGVESYDLFAFEPVPSTAKALKAAFTNNPRVHFERLALSSQTGADVMFVVGEAAGTNSLHCHNDDDLESMVIEKTTASEYCSMHDINIIHLLKCDTEGHDMEVIAGAVPLLREGRIAVLQFEYNFRWVYSRHYLMDVFKIVKGLPYRVGKVRPYGIDVYDKWHPEHERYFESNYVLIRTDVLSWFHVRECALDVDNTFYYVNR